MKMTSGNLKMESVYLKASAVEPTLVSCIGKSSFSVIRNYLHRVVPSITESNVKEDLFYLINSSIINYLKEINYILQVKTESIC